MYAQGMILGLSIRKNAAKIGVCINTSFYMRHKILDCIRVFMGTGNVDGVVEMDECFFPESYKWLQSFNDEKEIIRTKNMLIHRVVPFVDTRICSYHGRETIFI